MFTRWLASIALLTAPAWAPVARADDPSTEQAPAPSAAAPQETSGLMTKDLAVTVGKSLVVDSPVNIQRVSVANGDLAEAVAEFGVESGQCGAAIAGLLSVDVDEEEILAVEADIDRMKVDQGADEQTGAHHEEQ